MKTLLSIIFILSFYISEAQPYIPMLQEGNAWSVGYYDIYMPTTYNQLTLGNTVLINNTEYKNIYINSTSSDCFIREENGIVYILDSSNTEKIILDLSLEVGDIFTSEYISCLYDTYHELEVLSISNQFIAGMDRKVLELDGWGSQYWIEGIGSTKGGLYVGVQNIEGGSGLECFYTNGETYLFNNATDCHLGIEEISKNQIILYPNPVSNTAILRLPIEASIDHVKIYNLAGKLVNEETISKENITINASDYRSGIYFYQVISDKAILKTAQFIVN
jgi:hypothetical protein